MRGYILTDTERKAIKQFLKDGKATNLIYVLRHRVTKSLEQLQEDLKLLSTLLER